MTRPLCIYHGNCADGFTAAWAVWKAIPDCEFVPGVYGQEPPDVTGRDVTGRDVIMVDFSYKRPVINAMAKAARSILILDHHKTAAQELDGFPSPSLGNRWVDHLLEADAGNYYIDDDAPDNVAVIFDMDRSGAQIAWDFFHPGAPRPKLVDYVADRDLWRFALPESREIAAWLFSLDYDFSTWDSATTRLERLWGRDAAVREGAAIERKHHKDIAELLKVTHRRMVIGGMRVLVANMPYTMASDAAGLLAAGEPFAATYFDRGDGQRQFSLRSDDEGLDVSIIAKLYGGGGHQHAAGFQVPIGWEGDTEESK